MKAMGKLLTHLKTRLVDLNEARRKGCKVIGSTPHGYLPEELALACGAILAVPTCLGKSKDLDNLMAEEQRELEVMDILGSNVATHLLIALLTEIEEK